MTKVMEDEDTLKKQDVKLSDVWIRNSILQKLTNFICFNDQKTCS